jgi:hypothetical protein
MKVMWFDEGCESKGSPHPDYPNGIDVDCSGGAEMTCTQPLSYPAKRCGQYLVVCEACGKAIVITTAGRPDDPRSVKIACKITKRRAEQGS